MEIYGNIRLDKLKMDICCSSIVSDDDHNFFDDDDDVMFG